MATVAVKEGAFIVDKHIKRRFGFLHKSEKEIFKSEVANNMRAQGATEELIARELTDNAVEEAICNHFSAESLAWALLQ